MKVFGRALLYLVIALSILLLFLHFDLKPDLGDEGILAMDGWRICNGEIPQKDFFQFIPPLAAYLQALSFKIFSPSVFSIRILGLLYGIILFSLSYWLFKKFLKNELFLALSLSFLIPFGVGAWLFGSHHWLCDILEVASMLLLIFAKDNKSLKAAVISGMFLGFATFALQDQGGYAVIGLLIAGIFASKSEKQLFLVPAASAILTFMFLSLPFAIFSSPEQLFIDWVYFPVFNYKGAGGNQVSFIGICAKITEFWDPYLIKLAPFYSVGSAISSSFLYLTPILSIVSLVFLWIKKVMPKAELLILTVFSFASLLGAFHRIALTNLSWAFLALLPFYISLEFFSKNSNKRLKTASFAIAFILLLGTISFSIARINLCLKNDKLHTVNTPAGSYRIFNPIETKNLQQFVDAIEKNVPANEPIFCIGYIPLVNFLSQHPNPTKFNFMFFGSYYSKEQVISWAEFIANKKVIWGISDRDIFNEAMRAQLVPSYRPVFKNDKYILWKKEEFSNNEGSNNSVP
jgi:hypothetical protein